ncbi:MAG: helix-turn-helix transcriptional regulator [Lachnospiraceae bacterium]|nr:helix-turn-helix transcriptional regulator [Lachnospiraceae bacterium]
MVSYNKLWKLLIDKRMKKKDLAEAAGISANTIAKMGRDALVSLEVLVRICRTLKCDIGDIVEVIPLSDADNGSTKHE